MHLVAGWGTGGGGTEAKSAGAEIRMHADARTVHPACSSWLAQLYSTPQAACSMAGKGGDGLRATQSGATLASLAPSCLQQDAPTYTIPASAEPCSTVKCDCARRAGLVQAVSRQARVVIHTARFCCTTRRGTL